MFAQGFERDRRLDPALELKRDAVPARRIGIAVGVVIGMLGIERGRLRKTCAGNPHDADDARHLAARVIEEGAIALAHLVAQEVPRLVVADSVPDRLAVLRTLEIIDAERRRLGLEQPVVHAGCLRWRCSVAVPSMTPRSVTMRSSGTSHGAAAIGAVCWQANPTPTSSGLRHARPRSPRRRRARS